MYTVRESEIHQPKTHQTSKSTQLFGHKEKKDLSLENFICYK